MGIEHHERFACGLGLADELVDLGFVQQQFARAQRLGVHMGASGGQRSNLHADNKDFFISDDAMRLADQGLSCADGFDFPAFKSDACFESFIDKVIVEGFFVLNGFHCVFQARSVMLKYTTNAQF